MASKPRIKVPKSASAGEVITIKTLISHEMESGQRKDKDGNPIPRQIINKFTCTFNGKTVMSAKLEPSISANPYIEFEMSIQEAGDLAMKWHDDDGSVYEASNAIAIG